MSSCFIHNSSADFELPRLRGPSRSGARPVLEHGFATMRSPVDPKLPSNPEPRLRGFSLFGLSRLGKRNNSKLLERVSSVSQSHHLKQIAPVDHVQFPLSGVHAGFECTRQPTVGLCYRS